MKRFLAAVMSALLAIGVHATTFTPIPLLSTAGSISGQVIASTGPSTAAAWTNVSAASLAAQAANTVVANVTGSSASPTAFVMPTCSASGSALQWTSGTGFACYASVATSGANSNITSLSGLTTPLSIGQGGTGAATQSAALTALLGASTVPIANGGTNAASASAARTNLGAAASGTNTDITSLNAPALGSSTATTQTASDNTTKVATDQYVTTAVSNFSANRNQPYWSLYLAANQTVTAGTATKITMNTKSYDSGTVCDATTNYRCTPTVGGKYLMCLNLQMQGVSSAVNQYAPVTGFIYKNGTATMQTQGQQLYYFASGLTLGAGFGICSMVQMNGTTDYVEAWAQMSTVGSTTVIGGATLTNFSAFYMGP